MEMGCPLHSWQFQKGIDDSRQLRRFSLGNRGLVEVLYNWLIGCPLGPRSDNHEN